MDFNDVRIPRPYIPIKTRIMVARRQILALPDNPFTLAMKPIVRHVSVFNKTTLELLLATLGMRLDAQLDHNPPLMLRKKLYHNGKHVAYSPPANDPDFLIYRIAENHRIKTFIHGDGAQRSDMAQRRYLKRVNASRNPKPKFKPRKPKQIRRISDAVPVIQRHGAKAE